MIAWKRSKIEGRIGVSVPYNEPFNMALKALTPSAKFERASGAWFFDEEVKAEVTALLAQFYVDVRRMRLTWDLDRADNVTVDGATFFWVNRDDYSLRRDGPAFRILENELRTGGSRRYPNLSGRLVVEMDLRQGAVIVPEPDEIEPAPDAAPPNPLAHVDTADLLAELERRGVPVQPGEVHALEAIRLFLPALDGRDRQGMELSIEQFRRLAAGPSGD